MPRKVLLDMTGLRYGRLVGLGFSHRGPHGHAHWHFSCDCGARVTVDGSKVRSGNTTSCGCRHREISAARLTVHGHRARKRHGLTYRAWQAMKGCCADPVSPKFDADGARDSARGVARNIAVWPGWAADYGRFLRDMGERPPGTVLERVDGAGGFAPGNCVWTVTPTRAARAAKGWERRRAAPRAAVPAPKPPPATSPERPAARPPEPRA